MRHTKATAPANAPMERPSLPRHASLVWFVVLVWAFAGMQRLSSLIERSGLVPPAWLDDVTLVVGGAFAPVWAMLIVGSLTLGWPALRQLMRQGVRVQLSARLYLVALLVPMAAVGLASLMSGTRLSGIDADPLALVAQILVLALPFALAEQLGWRVWLQRGLQTHVSPALAGVLVGVVWVGHHLPLFAADSHTLHSDMPFVGFLAVATAFSVLLAALFNASGGSVVPVVVAHVAWNVAMQFALPVDLGTSTPLLLTVAAVFAAIAVVVALWSRARATEHAPAIL